MARLAAARRLSAEPAVVAELARPSDEPELRRLLRDNPMDGTIRLSLEREPDAFLAASVEGRPHATVVLRDTRSGRIVGMGSRAVMSVFVNGAPRRVGYLGQLRLERGARGRHLLIRGFERVRALRAAGEEPYDLTAIVADNARARRLLGAGLPGLPSYRPLSPFVTRVLPTWPAPRAVSGIEPAGPARLAEAAACLERNGPRFQMARRWTAADLASEERCRGLSASDVFLAFRGGRVAGCAALWDQRAFKQVVVRGYARPLARARPWINGLARILGTPRLPAPGAPLAQAYLSHLAVDGDDPVIFARLLLAVLAEGGRRGLAYVVAGFAESHPLLAVARRLRRAREYASLLHVVHWEEGRAAVEGLDGRVPHVEVALL